mgnify:CR=1 FL=1|jgi:lysine 2,3-aminomutase
MHLADYRFTCTMIPENNFENWKWQQRNSFRNLSDLLCAFPALPRINDYKLNNSHAMDEVLRNYPMSITPYYASLIKTFDKSDPIFNQILPTRFELIHKEDELNDPISDENPKIGFKSVRGIIHRYPDRVLFSPTPICSIHCRYCFRKRLVGKGSYSLTNNEIAEAINYVSKHKNIREVIFTGGDPLSLSDDLLFDYLLNFSNISHIKTIRIHSRYPVGNPFRLTAKLLSKLKNISTPIWLVTHFNSHVELTNTSMYYLNRFIENGIPVLNQSVLLKGVNDTENRLKKLLLGLIENKIQPYYLHQADLVKGTSHLTVSTKKGLQLFKNIRGQIPGYAIPTYIWDRPGGIGKIPLSPEW